MQEDFDTGIACKPHATGSAYGSCPAGTACSYFDANPGNGINSFDSVPLALIAFMQLITFDDWATPMYGLMGSFSPYVWSYFVVGVMAGGCFVVNLFLAVIFLEFGNAQAAIAESSASLEEVSAPAPARRSTVASVVSRQSSRSPGSKADLDAPRRPTRRVWCSVESPWRRTFTSIATSDWLGNFSTGLVLVRAPCGRCVSVFGRAWASRRRWARECRAGRV